MKAHKFLMMLVLACLVNGGAAFAVDEQAVSPEEQAKTEKMKALMAPGPSHKVLEAFAGKWNYSSKFWMSPEGKPEETTGVAEHTMVYGGRFLKQSVTGTWMGQPFEGIGATGYDNVRGQYQTVWIDSMGTGIMWISGQYDPATKTLSQSGSNSCPLTGEKDMKSRSEWKWIDNDHNVYTGYMTGPDGKEIKTMEIQYQRAA